MVRVGQENLAANRVADCIPNLQQSNRGEQKRYRLWILQKSSGEQSKEDVSGINKYKINMAFQPGQVNNPAGRPPGSTNKTTLMVRQLFADILEAEQENFKEALERLRQESPKDYVQVVTKLSQKFLPDLTITAIQNADGSNIEPIQIILPPPTKSDDE